MTGNIWWIGPVVLVLLRVLYSEARSTRASNTGAVIVFRVALGARLLLAFGISAFCILIVKSVGHEETWIVAGGTLLTLFACFSWPSTITIDAGGITSNVWWKPKVIIPWNAVADLEKGAGGDWTIYASGGKTLSFSRYHVDPQRFEAEVLKRANIGRPREKSEPTTLRL